jgi:outer membrane protein TolC
VQGSYSYGAINSSAAGGSGLQEQQRAAAGAGFNLSLATLGQLKTAGATQRLAALEVERQLDRVRAQVVSAQQLAIANAKLIPIAQQQREAAEETLRLVQQNLRAGTMLSLESLAAQSEVEVARLRHATALVQYNQSQLNLLAALGLLDSPKLLPKAEPATTQPTE